MNGKPRSCWSRLANTLVKYFAFGFIGVCLAVMVVGIVLPLGDDSISDPLERIGKAQLYCGVLTFLVIIFGLYPVMRQLRISEARPKLALAFDASGRTETTFDITEGKDEEHQLQLWMTNLGDAVAKEWQVDLDAPEVFTPYHRPPYQDETVFPSDPTTSADRRTRTISFYNLVLPCFVNRPVRVINLSLWTKADLHSSYPSECTVAYRVFGTWSPDQSGKLKVRFKKVAASKPQPT